MKKLQLLVLALTIAIALSACGGPAARSRDNLPQSTRPAQIAAMAAGPRSQGGTTETGQPAAATATQAQGGSADGGTTFFEREDGTIVFFVGHQAEATHPLHLGVLRFQEEVEARSEGALAVEILYGGTVGSDMAVRNMVLAGEIDVGAITTWGIWQDLTPAANLESLPFLFDSYEEAWAAYEGTLGTWVAQNIIEPNNAISLGFWTNGLRHFTNNIRPIYRPGDLHGLRMRSMQMAIHLDMYETFGAASLSLPFGEVFGALQSGMADGQDNPFGNIHAAQLYTVQNYLSLSRHMYSCAPIIASTDFWNFLSQEHRDIILESAQVAGRFQGETTVALEMMQLAEIVAHGTSVNEVDVAAFRTAVTPIWEDYMQEFGNDFAIIAARYINDPNSLASRFSS